MHKWKAKWIEPEQANVIEEETFTLVDMFQGKKPIQDPVEKRLLPSQYLKKVFVTNTAKKLLRATLFITAHGLYQVRINSHAVTEAVFTPDYTSYDKFLQYQEYDVTKYVEDESVLAIVLADGWYAGRISMTGGSAQFGNRLGVLAELIIEYADGSRELIGTDESFRSSTGKYVYSDIFIGEKQDLRLEKANWMSDTSVQGWSPVTVAAYGYDNLQPQIGPQVRRKEFLKLKDYWLEGEALILDFGQVIAGRTRFELHLAAGEEIRLEHSEILTADGKFFNNIVGRNKEQLDILIGDGSVYHYEPDFTFHGFRYVKVSGKPQAINLASVEAVVIYSDMKQTGSLKTTDENINQLLQNIEWSQKGNMLSVPTDCPQRERLGWTGDAQIFAPTAAFFMDVEDFFIRWLESVKADQQPNGEIVDYSPVPRDYFTTRPKDRGNSSAGWGDAIILVPWTLYKRYGNTQILSDTYEAMVRWHEFCKNDAKGEKTDEDQYIWDTTFHYGDWMFPSVMSQKGPFLTAKFTKDLVGTAFLAHSSERLAQIAAVLGKEAAAAGFEAYASKVKKAFQNHFWQEDKLTADYQGLYVLAIAFNLLDEAKKQAAVNRLIELIAANDYRLDTGFVSVPYLMDVLTSTGHLDIAERILFQKNCPSWLYEINQGATTIWESWDAIKPDGEISSESFNHYAYGCVGDWLVRNVGGLEVKAPGFKEFYVRPNAVQAIEGAELTYDTPYGTIQLLQRQESLTVAVPENTAAYVESSCILTSPDTKTTVIDGVAYIMLSPGRYEFPLKAKEEITARVSK